MKQKEKINWGRELLNKGGALSLVMLIEERACPVSSISDTFDVFHGDLNDQDGW